MKKLQDLLNDDDLKFSKPKTFKNYKQNFKPKSSDIFDFLALINSWDDIVGERLSKHTVPLKLNGKALTILTDHPVYAQKLSFMEKVLIDKIVAKFPVLQPEVKKIFFKADNNYFQKQVSKKTQKEEKAEIQKKKWHPHSPEYKKAVKEADSLLQDIKDDDIKAKLKSIYLQLK